MELNQIIAQRLTRKRLEESKKLSEYREFNCKLPAEWEENGHTYKVVRTMPGRCTLEVDGEFRAWSHNLADIDDALQKYGTGLPGTVRESEDDLTEDMEAPARNSDSTTEEKIIYAKHLMQKAKDNADIDAAWDLIDFLYDTMLLDNIGGLQEDLTIDDDPEETEQKYSSKDTSINSNQLPRLFKLVKFEKGSVNLDYGGGKFDNVADYLEDTYGATNLVYDKYNRTADHNKEVLKYVRELGGADTVTCSNVLNVIAEESERLAVLRNCKRYLKAGGTCYITVYIGDKSGEGKVTKSGYQLNKDTKDYEEEIKQVFSSVTRKGRLFICN